MREKRVVSLRLLLLFLLPWMSMSLGGCFRRTVWVYTSLPQEAIARLVGPIEAGVPSAEVKWYVASSDGVSRRLEQDAEEGDHKADLVITGDLLWYEGMRRAAKLEPYDSPAAAALPERFRDPSRSYATLKVSVMTLAYQSGKLRSEEAPQRWVDTTAPRWKGKIAIGNPLESDAAFLFVGALSRALGWDYFRSLRKLNVAAESGSAPVVARIEDGRSLVGAALLETIIRANLRGVPVRPVFPLDGVILVPGWIALHARSPHPKQARQVYDWLLSPAAQSVLVRAGYYSPLPGMPSPDKARLWPEILAAALPWDSTVAAALYDSRDQIRARFSDAVLH